VIAHGALANASQAILEAGGLACFCSGTLLLSSAGTTVSATELGWRALVTGVGASLMLTALLQALAAWTPTAGTGTVGALTAFTWGLSELTATLLSSGLLSNAHSAANVFRDATDLGTIGNALYSILGEGFRVLLVMTVTSHRDHGRLRRP
jgi:hypothetical protein